MPTSLIRVIERDGLDDQGRTRFRVREVARERRRGTYADPRPDELAQRRHAQHERDAERERVHELFEAARLAR